VSGIEQAIRALDAGDLARARAVLAGLLEVER